MAVTNVFQRFEVKFLLDKSQYNELIKVLKSHNVYIDQYGKTLIQSIYYDNEKIIVDTGGFTKKTFIIKITEIIKIQKRQNPIQKIQKVVDIHIYCKSYFDRHIKCVHIKEDIYNELIDLLN